MTEKKILVDLLNYMFDENREPWNNETNEKIIDSYLASNSYLSLHLVSKREREDREAREKRGKELFG